MHEALPVSFFLDAARIALLEGRVAAEDRNGYFSLLAEWGDTYAVLALEVVNHSGVSGRMANVFMAESALVLGKVADESSAQTLG